MQYDIWFVYKHVRRARWDEINIDVSGIWIFSVRRKWIDGEKDENERNKEILNTDRTQMAMRVPLSIEVYTLNMSICIEWDLISTYIRMYRITVNRLLKCQQLMNNGRYVEMRIPNTWFPFNIHLFTRYYSFFECNYAGVEFCESMCSIHTTSTARDLIAMAKCKGCDRTNKRFCLWQQDEMLYYMSMVPGLGTSLDGGNARPATKDLLNTHLLNFTVGWFSRCFGDEYKYNFFRRRMEYSCRLTLDFFINSNYMIIAESKRFYEALAVSTPALKFPHSGTMVWLRDVGMHCQNPTMPNYWPLLSIKRAFRTLLKCKCTLFVIYLQCSADKKRCGRRTKWKHF